MTGETLGIFIAAHAHFGVLGILAVALGLAVDHFHVAGNRRTAVTWLFIIGQWLLPATLIGVAFGMGILGILAYLWGILLFVSMAIMAWTAWSEDVSPV